MRAVHQLLVARWTLTPGGALGGGHGGVSELWDYQSEAVKQWNAIVADGGKALMPATDLPVGRIAMVADPMGAGDVVAQRRGADHLGVFAPAEDPRADLVRAGDARLPEERAARLGRRRLRGVPARLGGPRAVLGATITPGGGVTPEPTASPVIDLPTIKPAP